MAPGLPSDADVRRFAEATNCLDENGNYTVSRAKLMKGTQLWLQGLEDDEQSARESTANRLKLFYDELTAAFADVGSPHTLARDVIPHAAGALITFDGLHLREDPQPHD